MEGAQIDGRSRQAEQKMCLVNVVARLMIGSHAPSSCFNYHFVPIKSRLAVSWNHNTVLCLFGPSLSLRGFALTEEQPYK
jgi:hypothetical protein